MAEASLVSSCHLRWTDGAQVRLSGAFRPIIAVVVAEDGLKTCVIEVIVDCPWVHYHASE